MEDFLFFLVLTTCKYDKYLVSYQRSHLIFPNLFLNLKLPLLQLDKYRLIVPFGAHKLFVFLTIYFSYHFVNRKSLNPFNLRTVILYSLSVFNMHNGCHCDYCYVKRFQLTLSRGGISIFIATTQFLVITVAYIQFPNNRRVNVIKLC